MHESVRQQQRHVRVATGKGSRRPLSCCSGGRCSYRAALRAASTGSVPANGGWCSNSWYRIMENEYTSTCTKIAFHSVTTAKYFIELNPGHRVIIASRKALSALAV